MTFQVVKALWGYIKSNNLQEPSNRQKIILDDKLATLFSKPLSKPIVFLLCHFLCLGLLGNSFYGAKRRTCATTLSFIEALDEHSLLLQTCSASIASFPSTSKQMVSRVAMLIGTKTPLWNVICWTSRQNHFFAAFPSAASMLYTSRHAPSIRLETCIIKLGWACKFRSFSDQLSFLLYIHAGRLMHEGNENFTADALPRGNATDDTERADPEKEPRPRAKRKSQLPAEKPAKKAQSGCAEEAFSKPNALTRPLKVSPELSEWLRGETEISRPQLTKRFWAYAKVASFPSPVRARVVL